MSALYGEANRRTLIAMLIEANQALGASEDQLQPVLEAFVATIMALDYDPAIRRRGLTRPLWMLAKAARDVQFGARSRLLRVRKGQRGRPTGVSFDQARGTIAACCDYLIDGGETRQAAGQFMQKELRLWNIRTEGGRLFTSAAVLRLRDEIGGRAAEAVTTRFREMLKLWEEVVGATALTNQADRRVFVAGVVLGLAGIGF
jgi:hypothetical protein